MFINVHYMCTADTWKSFHGISIEDFLIVHGIPGGKKHENSMENRRVRGNSMQYFT